jgi:hypothetical protein
MAYYLIVSSADGLRLGQMPEQYGKGYVMEF